MRRSMGIHIVFVTIISTAMFSPLLNGEENNQETFPSSFLEFERSESPLAYIYSQNEQACTHAKALMNDVAEVLTKMTGEKIEKGIVIVTSPLTKHPISLFLDLAEQIADEDLLAMRSDLNEITEKGAR